MTTTSSSTTSSSSSTSTTSMTTYPPTSNLWDVPTIGMEKYNLIIGSKKRRL